MKALSLLIASHALSSTINDIFFLALQIISNYSSSNLVCNYNARCTKSLQREKEFENKLKSKLKALYEENWICIQEYCKLRMVASWESIMFKRFIYV